MTNGIHIVFLPVNNAWAVMWHSHILCICNSKADAKAEAAYLIRRTKESK